jgi:hypothetical protein
VRTVLAALAGLLGLALFMGVIFAGCGAFMKSRGGYPEGLALLRADPAATAALGTPIRDGFFVTGEVASDGMDAHSSYVVRVRGPRGSGRLRIRGYRAGGAWRVTGMTLETAGGERLEYVPGVGFARVDV